MQVKFAGYGDGDGLFGVVVGHADIFHRGETQATKNPARATRRYTQTLAANTWTRDTPKIFSWPIKEARHQLKLSFFGFAIG
jgi:hypothetical protein